MPLSQPRIRDADTASLPSATRDDFDNLQPVARVEGAFGKLRRRDRLAVVLHHHAPRQELLRDEKCLDRARQFRLDGFSVGDDRLCIHQFVKNIQQPTSNVQHPVFRIGRSLDVRRWLFMAPCWTGFVEIIVRRGNVHVPRPAEKRRDILRPREREKVPAGRMRVVGIKAHPMARAKGCWAKRHLSPALSPNFVGGEGD